MPGPKFPSLKRDELLRALTRLPLGYTIDGAKGSHLKLRSSNGYPPLIFAFHPGVTIPSGLVRTILCSQVGLETNAALEILGG